MHIKDKASLAKNIEKILSLSLELNATSEQYEFLLVETCKRS